MRLDERGNLWVAAGINCSPPRAARPPTSRRASTSSRPAASCWADPDPRRRLHQPRLRRPRPQDALRHLGQDRLQGPAGRLRVCPISAREGVIGTPREDVDQPDGPADRQRSSADYADGPAADAEAACLDPAEVAVAREHPEPDREGDGGRAGNSPAIRMTARPPRWRYRLPGRRGRGPRPRGRDSRLGWHREGSAPRCDAHLVAYPYEMRGKLADLPGEDGSTDRSREASGAP